MTGNANFLLLQSNVYDVILTLFTLQMYSVGVRLRAGKHLKAGL